MAAFRDTLGPRINALKEIGKNLIELAWLLFTAAQWFIVIAVPLYLMAAVICLLTGRSVPPIFHDTTLLSIGGYFYSFLLLILLAAFAYGYLLKIRPKGEPDFGRKCYVMALYLCVLTTLNYKIELSEQRYVLKQIRYSEATIRLYDAETQQPLSNVSLLGPPVSNHSVLPQKYSISTLPNGGFVIKLIDIQPVELGFNAPGYQRRRLSIGQKEGEETYTIYLKKEAAADPNTPSI